MDIKDFKLGETLRINGYKETNHQFRRRLISFGLIPGAEFKLVRFAPMGDPIQIEVMGSQIALRHSDVEGLQLSVSSS